MNFQETRVIKNDKVFTKTIEGELFLIDLDSAVILKLNEVGAFLWEALSQTDQMPDLLERIGKEFAVEDHQAQSDILSFLKELKKNGLIFVTEGP